MVNYAECCSFFLNADHQGSIVSVTGASNNAPIINSYNEWGIPAATNTGRFQYTGQAWLPEIGMYYYKARIYSPTLGRFMQTDPIGYDDQVNLYAYVGNDPVNMSDPDGQQMVVTGIIDWKQAGELFDSAVETVKNDPGIVLDVVMIAADIATIPSGEAAIGISIRRGSKEAAESIGQKTGRAAAENRATNIKKGIPESQIGPSGKPMQHTNVHSSKKEAREAAERNAPKGGSVRHDRNPSNSKQGSHFQAEKPNGTNVHPTVHQEYPKRKLV